MRQKLRETGRFVLYTLIGAALSLALQAVFLFSFLVAGRQSWRFVVGGIVLVACQSLIALWISRRTAPQWGWGLSPILARLPLDAWLLLVCFSPPASHGPTKGLVLALALLLTGDSAVAFAAFLGTRFNAVRLSRRFRVLVAVGICACLLVSYGSFGLQAGRFALLHKGMTESEVVAIMGPPEPVHGCHTVPSDLEWVWGGVGYVVQVQPDNRTVYAKYTTHYP